MTCATCRGSGEVSHESPCVDAACPRRAEPHPMHVRCEACGGHGRTEEHKPGCAGAPCFCGHVLAPSGDLFAAEVLYPAGWNPPAQAPKSVGPAEGVSQAGPTGGRSEE